MHWYSDMQIRIRLLSWPCIVVRYNQFVNIAPSGAVTVDNASGRNSHNSIAGIQVVKEGKLLAEIKEDRSATNEHGSA